MSRYVVQINDESSPVLVNITAIDHPGRDAVVAYVFRDYRDDYSFSPDNTDEVTMLETMETFIPTVLSRYLGITDLYQLTIRPLAVHDEYYMRSYLATLPITCICDTSHESTECIEHPTCQGDHRIAEDDLEVFVCGICEQTKVVCIKSDCNSGNIYTIHYESDNGSTHYCGA